MENSEILHETSRVGHYLPARRKGRPAQERILHILIRNLPEGTDEYPSSFARICQ